MHYSPVEIMTDRIYGTIYHTQKLYTSIYRLFYHDQNDIFTMKKLVMTSVKIPHIFPMIVIGEDILKVHSVLERPVYIVLRF